MKPTEFVVRLPIGRTPYHRGTFVALGGSQRGGGGVAVWLTRYGLARREGEVGSRDGESFKLGAVARRGTQALRDAWPSHRVGSLAHEPDFVSSDPVCRLNYLPNVSKFVV
jgi:hypothetical protein